MQMAALEYLELDIKIYNKSYEVYSKMEEGKMVEITKLDMSVRKELEHEFNPLTEDRETIVKAFKRKLQLDFAVSQKIHAHSKTLPQDKLQGL